jgi:hypothetical protein
MAPAEAEGSAGETAAGLRRLDSALAEVAPAVEGFPPTQQFPRTHRSANPPRGTKPPDCLRRANHGLGGVYLSASEPIPPP